MIAFNSADWFSGGKDSYHTYTARGYDMALQPSHLSPTSRNHSESRGESQMLSHSSGSISLVCVDFLPLAALAGLDADGALAPCRCDLVIAGIKRGPLAQHRNFFSPAQTPPPRSNPNATRRGAAVGDEGSQMMPIRENARVEPGDP